MFKVFKLLLSLLSSSSLLQVVDSPPPSEVCQPGFLPLHPLIFGNEVAEQGTNGKKKKMGLFLVSGGMRTNAEIWFHNYALGKGLVLKVSYGFHKSRLEVAKRPQKYYTCDKPMDKNREVLFLFRMRAVGIEKCL